jgi:hypothetical protein
MLLQNKTNLALQAAGFIGTWDTDVPAARSILDEGAAALLAGDASLAGQPLPLEVALHRTHPDDRDWLFERIYRARRTGGPVSAEFRVLTEPGEIRWVLDRGGLAPDETGAMHGCGVFIDTTDSHRGPFWPSDVVEPQAVDLLDTAVEHYLAAHAVITRTNQARVQQLSHALLMEIGRVLARRISA